VQDQSWQCVQQVTYTPYRPYPIRTARRMCNRTTISIYRALSKRGLAPVPPRVTTETLRLRIEPLRCKTKQVMASLDNALSHLGRSRNRWCSRWRKRCSSTKPKRRPVKENSVDMKLTDDVDDDVAKRSPTGEQRYFYKSYTKSPGESRLTRAAGNSTDWGGSYGCFASQYILPQQVKLVLITLQNSFG